MNLPARLSTFEAEIAEYDAKLAVASQEGIARLLGSLMASSLQVPPGIKPDDLTTVYSFALSACSMHGIKTAVMKFIRGEYANQSHSFMPTPPALAIAARAEDAKVREDRFRALRFEEARKAGKPVKKTPEQIEKARKLLAAARLQHAEFKRSQHKSAPVEMPPSEQEREDIRMMLALPDRPEISFEETERRSKMAAKLEGLA